MENWKSELIVPALLEHRENAAGQTDYKWLDGCLANSVIIEQQTKDDLWHESSFQGLVEKRHSTTWAESQILKEKLAALLTKYKIEKDATILDVGCADGRTTNFLLEIGYQKIVATDWMFNLVARFISGLDSRQRQSVLGLVDDINCLPIKDNVADLVVAWGLFTATPDFEQALNSTLRMLKPGGIMISAEPVLEHSLIYALMRGDLDEFMRISKEKTRASMWEDKNQRYRVYTSLELEAMMSHAPIKILERDGISIFPSLVFGGVLQDQKVDDAKKEELWQAIQPLCQENLLATRQLIYVVQKL